MALEERIGNVNTGLNEETIKKHLKQKKYSAEPDSQRDAEPCCVCQVNNICVCFSLLSMHARIGFVLTNHVNFVLHRRSIRMEMISDRWIAGTIIILTVLNSG